LVILGHDEQVNCYSADTGKPIFIGSQQRITTGHEGSAQPNEAKNQAKVMQNR
jgi:hypothetical protein